MDNPHQTPALDISNPKKSEVVELEGARAGRQIQVIAFALILLLKFVISPLGELASIAFYLFAVGLGIHGIDKISRDLKWSRGRKLLYVTAAVLPVINLIILLAAYNEASKALKKAGYRMTFFGAKRPDIG